MSASFKLGTFSVAGSPPFAGVVMGERVVAATALQSICVRLEHSLLQPESVFGLLQAWDANMAALQAAIASDQFVSLPAIALDAV